MSYELPTDVCESECTRLMWTNTTPAGSEAQRNEGKGAVQEETGHGLDKSYTWFLKHEKGEKRTSQGKLLETFIYVYIHCHDKCGDKLVFYSPFGVGVEGGGKGREDYPKAARVYGKVLK